MPGIRFSTKRWATALLLGLAVNGAPLHADGEVALVSIKNFKFTPPELTVKAGTVVRWVNDEKRQYHSVWFESLGDPEPAYFFPEESYQRQFDRPGEFAYRCGPHPEMVGRIKVVE